LKRPEKEEKQIFAIQSRLMAPLVLEDEKPIDEPLGDKDQEMPPVLQSGESPVVAPRAANDLDAAEELRRSLLHINLTPLRFVAHSVGLDVSMPKLKKADYAEKLVAWVSLTKLIFYRVCINIIL
jgi:hypothetical protein